LRSIFIVPLVLSKNRLVSDSMKKANNSLLINCIYKAHEGEGIWVGSPQIFIRVQGCAIGCVNCDTKESWDFDEASRVTLDEILNQVEELSISDSREFPIKRISITGGDPLDPRHALDVLEISKELKARGFYINIEASGARLDRDIFAIVDFISFDFKTPSTEVRTSIQHIKKLFLEFPGKFQIKAVIAHKQDFFATYDAFIQLKNDHILIKEWVLTPCFEPGTEFSKKQFEDIVSWNYSVGGPFRVIGQQHKWIYGPNERQV